MKSLGLIFVALIGAAGVLSIAGWWIGPQLVQIALLDERRDQPYLLLDFVKTSGEQDEAYLLSHYQQPLTGLIASEGGVPVGAYTLVQLFEGTRADEWSHLNNFHLSRAQDLAQVMTSSPYRIIAGNGRVENFTLGHFSAQAVRWRAGLVIWLVRASEHVAVDNLAPVLATLEGTSGRLVWDKAAHIYHREQDWDRLVVLDFPSAEDALNWMRDPEVATARVIAGAKARRSMVAVYGRADRR
ncbi:MAG: DUF1330 domain-containing protein [Pseudomonadaceae bacterium]|nr:DUF1330 domain-containing protein [Pseudomonadaceae bacterium]